MEFFCKNHNLIKISIVIYKLHKSIFFKLYRYCTLITLNFWIYDSEKPREERTSSRYFESYFLSSVESKHKKQVINMSVVELMSFLSLQWRYTSSYSLFWTLRVSRLFFFLIFHPKVCIVRTAGNLQINVKIYTFCII